MSVEITDRLRRLGLEQYASVFRDNAIDAEILRELTADDLKDLGVNLVGHRRRLLAAIAALGVDGWAEQGRRAEAYALLAPVYGWFTEGLETADLNDAKVLLDELA